MSDCWISICLQWKVLKQPPVQTGRPAPVLIKSIENADFQEQIDVVEIFHISTTISVEKGGNMSNFFVEDLERF